MKTAHKIGMNTTATMVIGFGESLEERALHLLRVREAQDECLNNGYPSKGFLAFIPWTFQPDNTNLKREKATPEEYLKTLAISRITLDNIENFQSSWVTMGPEIGKVSAWAKSKGYWVIVDNTLLTPFFQRPIELGADIVIHSATKYLGGHNDVLAGLIVTKGEELSKEMAFLHNSIGAVLGPQDSWLLMRGMKTLALRMERHQENALRLASWLDRHPAVESVYYPGLPNHPGYEIQARQTSGNTGIFSFRMKDARTIEPILRHLRLIAFAESLGGVESLLTFPSVQTHADIPESIRQAVGVDDRLLRFSVGIEHADDLIADLGRAIEAAEKEIGGLQG